MAAGCKCVRPLSFPEIIAQAGRCNADFPWCMDETSDIEMYQDDLGLLTPADMNFLHTILGRDLLSAKELNGVVNEPTLRRQVLDSPKLFEEVSKPDTQLSISEFFYYCIIVRQVMILAGLEHGDYTENVAASLVRMAHMQRKSLKRDDSCSRYMPVNLQVIKERGPYGCHIRIISKLDPFEMFLEGFQVDATGYEMENKPVPESKEEAIEDVWAPIM